MIQCVQSIESFFPRNQEVLYGSQGDSSFNCPPKGNALEISSPALEGAALCALPACRSSVAVLCLVVCLPYIDESLGDINERRLERTVARGICRGLSFYWSEMANSFAEVTF